MSIEKTARGIRFIQSRLVLDQPCGVNGRGRRAHRLDQSLHRRSWHERRVNNLLRQVNIHDTAYAAAGDLAESDARIRVQKKSLLFSVRSRRLQDLYACYESLDQLDTKTRYEPELGYLGRSVWTQVYAQRRNAHSSKATGPEPSARKKLALMFGCHFAQSSELAQAGTVERKSDFQINCGPHSGPPAAGGGGGDPTDSFS
jgi:hypothetical protein